MSTPRQTPLGTKFIIEATDLYQAAEKFKATLNTICDSKAVHADARAIAKSMRGRTQAVIDALVTELAAQALTLRCGLGDPENN